MAFGCIGQAELYHAFALTKFVALIRIIMVVRQFYMASTFATRQENLTGILTWSNGKMLVARTERFIVVLSQFILIPTLKIKNLIMKKGVKEHANSQRNKSAAHISSLQHFRFERSKMLN